MAGRRLVGRDRIAAQGHACQGGGVGFGERGQTGRLGRSELAEHALLLAIEGRGPLEDSGGDSEIAEGGVQTGAERASSQLSSASPVMGATRIGSERTRLMGQAAGVRRGVALSAPASTAAATSTRARSAASSVLTLSSSAGRGALRRCARPGSSLGR